MENEAQDTQDVTISRLKADELEERLIVFAVRVIKLTSKVAQNASRKAYRWSDSAVRHFTGTELRRS